MRVWRRVAAVLILLLALAAVAVWIERDWREDQEMAFLRELRTAHEAFAAQPDFVRMKVEGEWVRLYLADGTEQVVSLPVDLLTRSMLPWWHPFRLAGGWKCGDDVFFITGGAVDDCWGYVLSADAEISLEGLNVLRRVGGYAWYFSTMAE